MRTSTVSAKHGQKLFREVLTNNSKSSVRCFSSRFKTPPHFAVFRTILFYLCGEQVAGLRMKHAEIQQLYEHNVSKNLSFNVRYQLHKKG